MFGLHAKKKQAGKEREVRLRQVCLVAEELEPVVADLTAVLGLDVAYRDPLVIYFGLENAVMPINGDFL